jgi:hypothetical protein
VKNSYNNSSIAENRKITINIEETSRLIGE